MRRHGRQHGGSVCHELRRPIPTTRVVSARRTNSQHCRKEMRRGAAHREEESSRGAQSGPVLPAEPGMEQKYRHIPAAMPPEDPL